MANVLLTTRCNLRCAYCFAQEKLQDDRNVTMTLSNVEKVIDFLKRSDHFLFRVMGGEPTLHPEFPQIMEMALQAGMKIDVLSNATWPQGLNDLFLRVSPTTLSFLLNVDHPKNYSASTWQKIALNLDAVAASRNVTLSFNIFEKQPQYQYVLDLLREHHIDKLRMSFSLPILGSRNTYLALEDYQQAASSVLDIVRKAEDMGVQVRLDNAVPLCVFSYEQAGELLLKGVLDLKRNAQCNPVIDIGPDLSVWSCFCLSKLWNRRLDEFENLQEVYAFYERALGLYQSRLFPMEKCSECRLRTLWNCQGGCLTFTIVKHGELPLEALLAQETCKAGEAEVPVRFPEHVQMRYYDLPQESFALFNEKTGAQIEIDGSFKPLLAMLDGRYSADEAVKRFLATNDGNPDSTLAIFANNAMQASIQSLLQMLSQNGFLVECEKEEVAGLQAVP